MPTAPVVPTPRRWVRVARAADLPEGRVTSVTVRRDDDALIGFGFPAAMGAWAAVGDTRPVWCVTGDGGGFGQHLAELTTAVRCAMPIRHVLLDDGELAKISKEQRAGHWDVWVTGLTDPAFAAYAEQCGALGLRAADRDELDAALATAAAHPGPVLVHVKADALLV